MVPKTAKFTIEGGLPPFYVVLDKDTTKNRADY